MTGDLPKTDQVSQEERDRAEEYRRERQKREAIKAGVDAIDPSKHIEWLLNNEELMVRAAIAGGATTDELPDFIREYRESLNDVSLGSEYDDPHALHIMNRVIKEIESICTKFRIPLRNGVVFGVTPGFGLVANQSPVMTTDASMIGLSLPFFNFCNAVAKATAKSLVYSKHGNNWIVDNRPSSIQAKLQAEPDILRLWIELLEVFGASRHPPDLSTPTFTPIEGTIRTQLLRSIELFSIAHEYGHHVLKHGVVESTNESEDKFGQEHDADVFGQTISMLASMSDAAGNIYAEAGVGAVLILGTLDLVRRAEALLATGSDVPEPRKSHPPFLDRIRFIAPLDKIAPENRRTELVDRRRSFCEIMEVIWSEVRPHLLAQHVAGVRPTDRRSDQGGWLPLA